LGCRTLDYSSRQNEDRLGPCLQLAHLDNTTVEGLYKKHGPLALIGSRTKLMQHWADRIDHWLDPKKVMPIKGGAQA
jgi:hypothetical protein